MNVLELYSGIGGMHYALKESKLKAEVVCAIDINTVAYDVYKHNFPDTKLLRTNIQALTAKSIDDMNVDMLVMSPPCQPFTRVGLQKDTKDERTNSLLSLLDLLPDLNKKLKYIVVENVKGFEQSQTRGRLVLALKRANFIWQEFIICPSQFMIPNTRHRYYLIAKRKPFQFVFEKKDPPMLKLPFPVSSNSHIVSHLYEQLMTHYQVMNPKKGEDSCKQLKQFLDPLQLDERGYEAFLLPDGVLAKRAWLLDIVTPESRRSCCFTKAYGHYVEGTGSVLCDQSPERVREVFEESKSLEAGSLEQLELLRSLKLRYFTPDEVARLMKFPPGFSFPEHTTVRQKYRLLGNSVNVYVVSRLIVLLTAGDEPFEANESALRCFK